MDISNKTYAKILADQLKRVPDALDKREGSIIHTALGPVSWYLEGVYLDMDRMQQNVFVETAGGYYLDRRAAEVGITRKAATFAVKKGVFDTPVPLGARFSALAGSEYLTYKAAEYIGQTGGQYAYKMQSERAGSAGDNYAGQLIAIDYVPGLVSAQLTSLILSGSDEEGDEDLRKRILIRAQKPASSGNKYDYYNWAMECAGTGAAKVFPLANGPGTVKVVIADMDMKPASNDLTQLVKERIEEVRPIGADVAVVSAIERAVNVSARVQILNGVNLGTVQSGFYERLENYLRSNVFDLSYISQARIGSLLLGTPGIADYDGLQINGSEENIKLGPEEIAVAGDVTLEVLV